MFIKNATRLFLIFLIQLNIKNIFRIFPSELFCNTTIEGRCLTHSENDVYYYDHNHLSSIGSKMLSKKILKVIKENN